MYKLIVTKLYEVEVEGVLCCEECNETIASFLYCPICNNRSHVYSLNLEEDNISTITCNKCNNSFLLVDDRWYDEPKVIVVKDKEV